MMGCGCENKKIMSDYERVAMLAKKAAMLDEGTEKVLTFQIVLSTG